MAKLKCMIKHKGGYLLILLSCVGWSLSAQHVSEKDHNVKPFHSIGIAIGHAHAFNGVGEDGKRKTLVLPYFGLDYNFQINQKWAIGVHTDFINETFVVEKHGSTQELERSRPIAPAAMAMYNFNHHWKIGLGMGGEFAKEGNLWLNRASIEYVCPIRKGWEVFGAFQYDIRWNAFDTWTIGLGIAYAFEKE